MNVEEEIILYEHLKPKIVEDCDKRYRKIEDCDEITGESQEKYSKDHVTLELLKNDMATFKKIGWTLVTASIAQLIVEIAERL